MGELDLSLGLCCVMIVCKYLTVVQKCKTRSASKELYKPQKPYGEVTCLNN